MTDCVHCTWCNHGLYFIPYLYSTQTLHHYNSDMHLPTDVEDLIGKYSHFITGYRVDSTCTGIYNTILYVCVLE